MTSEQEALILSIARRVLAEPGASRERVKWAEDAVLWLTFGDMNAARRCGYVSTVEQVLELQA